MLETIWTFAAPGAAALAPLAGAAGVSHSREDGRRTEDGTTLIPALLFIAGDYPDRGVTLTEADLDALIACFNAERESGGEPTPVKAEHHDTPLDPIGEVVNLRREGPNLYGTLAFSEGVARHLAERGARHLSVALRREPMGAAARFTLREVSLVFKGRVPGAALLQRNRAQEKLASFKAAGKVTPAMEEPALRLLSVEPDARFDEGSAAPGDEALVDVAAETIALLTALPALTPRGGQIPAFFAPEAQAARPIAPVPARTSALRPELEAICQRLGVPAENVRKRL